MTNLGRFIFFLMSESNVFVWNAHGPNMRARREAIREFLMQERVSVACLVETKLDVLPQAMASELFGMSFDYVLLPSFGASGGIVLTWNHDIWTTSSQTVRQFSVQATLQSEAIPSATPAPWSLAVVYSPVDESLKQTFLNELRDLRVATNIPLLIVGDFNLIYQATDKNNDRLNLRAMRQFRRALDDMQLQELHLHGRLYTWSNERRHPTLVRLDRAFADVQWFEEFPDHHLRSLSSDCSDHAPLLL
jgi:exonuclease III